VNFNVEVADVKFRLTQAVSMVKQLM